MITLSPFAIAPAPRIARNRAFRSFLCIVIRLFLTSSYIVRFSVTTPCDSTQLRQNLEVPWPEAAF